MSNNNPLVLTIDFGTQSLRTALINKQGEIEAIVKRKYEPPYFSKEKGYAEQNPDFYYEHLVKCLTELAKNNKDKLDRIKGSTIATFRDTSVQLDKDLKPVRDSILWLDQRLAKGSEKIPTLYSLLFKLVGMGETIKLNRSRTMAHWIKENEPDVWAKTHKYVNISTYLTYKLTNELKDSAANLTGHYPMNFKKGKWYKEGALKGVIFGIPSKMLFELKQPGEKIGEISEEICQKTGLPTHIPLFASGSDKACETLGLGALSNEIGAISYGTASTIEVSNKKYHEPEPFLPAYPAAVPNWYNMEVQIYRGYWMLSWFSKNFASELIDESKIQSLAIEEILNEKLSEIPPGSDGLVLQPYWGPGLRRPLAKGGIIGFSDIHTREHMYRAIIEGIAYALREGLEGIEKSQGHKIKELRISGGGSQSDAICQITADIFNLPVSRVQTFETTSLGAAVSVFVALKEYNNVEEAMSHMCHKTTTFMPNKEASEQYEDLYRKVYLQMFPRLKNVYKQINRFTKRY